MATWRVGRVAVFGMLRRASRLLAPILSDLEHGRTPTHRAVQRAHAYCRAAWSAGDEAGDDGSSSGEFPIRLADVAFAPPSGAPPTKGPPRVQRTLGRHLHARERERFMEKLVEVGGDHELAALHGGTRWPGIAPAIGCMRACRTPARLCALPSGW